MLCLEEPTTGNLGGKEFEEKKFVLFFLDTNFATTIWDGILPLFVGSSGPQAYL